GTLTPTATPGAYTYTPAPNYTGPDSFTYTVTDPDGLSDTGVVSVTVTAVNDPPVAVDDTKTTSEDTPLVFPATDLSANDTDADGNGLAVTAVSGALGGTVSLTAGQITFPPTANYTGPAGFDYTLSDNTLTDTGHVTVTINPVNDAPVAGDDTAIVVEDSGATTIT